ncbi:MAG: hypothetical protein MUC97_04240 [Bernardetiaceae bacterium]|jgi:hypothetical protein|nr:hypothetical protein [Bernardetiaceae bacterium]
MEKPQPTLGTTLSKVFDYVLTIGGSGISMIALANLTHHPGGFLAMLGVMGAGLTGAYRLLQRRHRQQLLQATQSAETPPAVLPSAKPTALPPKALTPNEDLQVRLLDIFALHKGRLTLVEMVVYLREPLDRILPVVEYLQKQGLIGADVTETGELIYTTSGFRVPQ